MCYVINARRPSILGPFAADVAFVVNGFAIMSVWTSMNIGM